MKLGLFLSSAILLGSLSSLAYSRGGHGHKKHGHGHDHDHNKIHKALGVDGSLAKKIDEASEPFHEKIEEAEEKLHEAKDAFKDLAKNSKSTPSVLEAAHQSMLKARSDLSQIRFSEMLTIRSFLKTDKHLNNWARVVSRGPKSKKK